MTLDSNKKVAFVLIIQMILSTITAACVVVSAMANELFSDPCLGRYNNSLSFLTNKLFHTSQSNSTDNKYYIQIFADAKDLPDASERLLVFREAAKDVYPPDFRTGPTFWGPSHKTWGHKVEKTNESFDYFISINNRIGEGGISEEFCDIVRPKLKSEHCAISSAPAAMAVMMKILEHNINHDDPIRF